MQDTSTDPCRMCGAPVRLVEGTAPKRVGEATARTVMRRHCTSPDCRANNGGPRRSGESV